MTHWKPAAEESLADLLAQHTQASSVRIRPNMIMQYAFEAAKSIDFLNCRGISHQNIQAESLLMC